MRYSQVFCALTDCQRDPRVLGCHIGMCLALVAKEVSSDSSIVDVPLKVENLLDNFVDLVPDGYGKSHFQIVNGYSPCTPIDLVPLPPHMRVSNLHKTLQNTSILTC